MKQNAEGTIQGPLNVLEPRATPESMCDCFAKLYIGFPDEDPGGACGAGSVLKRTKPSQLLVVTNCLPTQSPYQYLNLC